MKTKSQGIQIIRKTKKQNKTPVTNPKIEIQELPKNSKLSC